MNRNIYIGEFPPPVGGVTIKNSLLKDEIYKDLDMYFVDLYECKKRPYMLLLLVFLIIQADRILLGVGSNKRLVFLLKVIAILKGKCGLKSCSIFMMGSTLQGYCKSNLKATALMRKTNVIYTESNRINDEFISLGIDNVKFYPNCRSTPNTKYYEKQRFTEKIDLVFFSKICKEKGADLLFDVVDQLSRHGVAVSLDYYGIIDKSYRKEFEERLATRTLRCRYCGIFDASKNDVYDKLREYDVLVFPSTWKGEGVPGILVESKIAGIPAIVSNHNYNGEIVLSGEEGIVVDGNLVPGFVDAVKALCNNDLYNVLANGAFKSRFRYDVSTYKDELVRLIKT